VDFFSILLSRRCGAGQDTPTEAGPVLVVFDKARGTNEIGVVRVRWIADQARRFPTVLYLLDCCEQRRAHCRNEDIGRTEPFLRAIPNGALGLNRKGILRRKIAPHAGEVIVSFLLLAILKIAIFLATYVPIVGPDIFRAKLSQGFLVQGLRMPVEELEAAMPVVVDGDIPTPLISGFAGRWTAWCRTDKRNC